MSMWRGGVAWVLLVGFGCQAPETWVRGLDELPGRTVIVVRREPELEAWLFERDQADERALASAGPEDEFWFYDESAAELGFIPGRLDTDAPPERLARVPLPARVFAGDAQGWVRRPTPAETFLAAGLECPKIEVTRQWLLDLPGFKAGEPMVQWEYGGMGLLGWKDADGWGWGLVHEEGTIEYVGVSRSRDGPLGCIEGGTSGGDTFVCLTQDGIKFAPVVGTGPAEDQPWASTSVAWNEPYRLHLRRDDHSIGVLSGDGTVWLGAVGGASLADGLRCSDGWLVGGAPLTALWARSLT